MPTILNGVLAVLGRCDQEGVILRAADERISVRSSSGTITPELRDQIVKNRDAILAHLRAYPRPDPDPVLFVAPNLETSSLPFASAHATAVYAYGDRPYYALTPSVLVHLLTAADRRFRRPDGTYPVTDVAYLATVALFDQLAAWVNAHYRPDQIDRAYRKPLPLPVVPRCPV